VSYVRTPEIREKNAAALRGRKLSPSAIAALVASHTGIPLSPEHKELLRSFSIGRVPSERQRELSRIANLGKHPSDETRAKMSAAGKGKHTMSESTKAAIRLSRLGVPMSEETKRRISESKKGKPLSERARIAMLAVSAGNVGRKESIEKRMQRSLAAPHGDKSPLWKGGVTPEITRIRTSSEYGQWRTSVFTRDAYTCQKCSAHSGKGHAVILEAHHMDCFADFPEKRLDVDNGITLCKECHHEFSLRYGMLHNRKWQTDEFLGGVEEG
jgi:hypothetical protein